MAALVWNQGRPTAGKKYSCIGTIENAYLTRKKGLYTELMSFLPTFCDFKPGWREVWMLRESQTVSPAPGRQQMFSSGFCFRLVLVLKESLYQNVSPLRRFSQAHKHSQLVRQTDRQTHTLPFTKWCTCRTLLGCPRRQFCAVYSGLLHAVMKHLSSLPHQLLLTWLESERFPWKEYWWWCN